jgi:hypothetical protein
MPNNNHENLECWDSLMDLLELGFSQNCIIAGEFNTTLHQNDKNGGFIVRDHFRERIEDLISFLDMIDIQPNKGKFTWNNRRACLL